jgi:hypothetical protein
MSGESGVDTLTDDERSTPPTPTRPVPPEAGTTEQNADRLLTEGVGDVRGSILGSHFSGSVTVNNWGHAQAQLVVRRATDDELNETRFMFVEPGGYRRADEILRDRHMVMIYKPGSGRSFAARRLLVDRGAKTVADINPDRPVHSVREDELEKGTGYIWNGGISDHPLSDRDADHTVGLLGALGCWLVILLDRPEQVPASGVDIAVALTAPSPTAVARAAVQGSGSLDTERALTLLENELAPGLADGDPPSRAARAADLALRAASGGLSADRALTELREDVRDSVARWFSIHLVIEYSTSLSLAIALLPDQPYDDVVESALRLDRALRTAELPLDVELAPRRLFATSKKEVLEATHAQVVLRDHPSHEGLYEETVRFERQDWGETLLHHVWREYPAAHLVLTDWMCSGATLNRFSDATRRALGTIITEVHAHQPLRLVEDLAKSRVVRQRVLAAAVLQDLADVHDLRRLVRDTLEKWAEDGAPAWSQWVAAVVYASPFGLRDPEVAFAQLRTIARSRWSTPTGAVVLGLLEMLTTVEWRETVLDKMVQWSRSSAVYPGVHLSATAVGLYAAGAYPHAGLDPDELVRSFPVQVRTLLTHAVRDQTEGRAALERLHALAVKAETDQRSADDLLRITQLLVPNLGWPRRARAVEELCVQHHGMRSRIRWTFHVARRMQRARSRRPAGPPVRERTHAAAS